MSALRPYVPRLVLDWLRDGAECAHRRIDGSLAFVDISGFTALTERLATRGTVGAEEMSDVLNDVFGDLLPAAYGLNAQLVKYGGDAVLLLFEGADHAARACRAAWQMQRTIRTIGNLRTSVGQVKLRMSVGIHSGPIDFYLVGSRHRELVVTGPAATATAAMEKVAEAGEIVVSPATASLLPPTCLGAPKGDGILVARAPRARAETAVEAVDTSGVDVAAALSQPLAAHLEHAPQMSEHRRVVPAFLEFSGIDALTCDEGPAAVADALTELVVVTQRACERYDVTFLATDINADGGKIILVGGAPSRMGDEEQRVLCALREVVDARPRLSVRAGVTAGRVFAGDFGTAYRRTWSIVGDSVNLAARLMAHAQPGEVVAHVDVLDECGMTFHLRTLPPFTVKGKRAPINAVAVGAVAQPADPASVDDDLPLVGRGSDVAVLAEAVADVAAGEGRWLYLVGDAGIGKTRLLRELRRTTPDLLWCSAACDLHTSLRPFAVLGQLVRGALGIAAEASPTETRARLGSLAATAGGGAGALEPFLPLLGPVLQLHLPATPEVADLDEDGRAQRLAGLIDDLVDAARGQQPVCLLIDDAQFVDAASLAVLDRIGTAIAGRRRLLLLAGRSVVGRASEDRRMVELRPLDVESTTALVTAACDDRPLLPHDVAAIVERAAGNPLFAVELTAARVAAGAAGELPDSVEAILTARIDALRADARHLLRVAAVFGQTLPWALLAAATSGDIDIRTAWPLVREFLVADSAGDVSFRLGLVRDAAYSGLPFRLRQALHGRAADELAAAGCPPGQLSHHLLLAGRHGEAFRTAVTAAEAAADSHAVAETALLYERALEAGRHDASVPAAELARVAELLGSAAFQLGDLDRAVAALTTARRHLGDDRHGQARLANATAEVHLRAGRFAQALQWLTRAERALSTLDDTDERVSELRIKMAASRAYARAQQGRFADALTIAEAAIAHAATAHATPAVAELYQILDLSHLSLGHVGVDYATRALEVWNELGNLSGQANMFNHLGIRAFFRGDWDKAVSAYQKAHDVSLRAGQDWKTAIMLRNIAEVRAEQGRLDEAEEQVRRALHVLRAVGSRDIVRECQLQLVAVLTRQRRLDEARAVLDEVCTGADAEGGSGVAVDIGVRQAEIALVAGDGAAALTLLDSALQDATARRQVQSLSLLHRLRGVAYAQCRLWSRAQEALEQAVALACEQRAAHDEAFAVHAGITVDTVLGRPGPASVRALRDDLFTRLGIVEPPAYPLPVALPEQKATAVASA